MSLVEHDEELSIDNAHIECSRVERCTMCHVPCWNLIEKWEQQEIKIETLKLSVNLCKCIGCEHPLRVTDIWNPDFENCMYDSLWAKCTWCSLRYVCFFDEYYQIRIVVPHVFTVGEARYRGEAEFRELYNRTLPIKDPYSEIPF